MKRIISKRFCNKEERSIKRDSHHHFLRESITDTCLLASLDRFIVLIWKMDVDSRISVGSPCIQRYRQNSQDHIQFWNTEKNMIMVPGADTNIENRLISLEKTFAV